MESAGNAGGERHTVESLDGDWRHGDKPKRCMALGAPGSRVTLWHVVAEARKGKGGQGEHR